MELGKVPPHDIEAEQAILGCMLTDRDSVISAIEVLKEDAFNRLQEVMISAGELTQKAPYKKIINNSFAEKSIQEVK